MWSEAGRDRRFELICLGLVSSWGIFAGVGGIAGGVDQLRLGVCVAPGLMFFACPSVRLTVVGCWMGVGLGCNGFGLGSGAAAWLPCLAPDARSIRWAGFCRL